jgi:hypothetical protein
VNEAAHDKNLRKLTGDDAGLLDSLPKAYLNDLEAERLQSALAALVEAVRSSFPAV